MTFFRKKSLVLTLFISLLAILVFSFSASAVENYDFINFTEEDALTFVDNHNIDVPTKLSQSNNAGEFTLSTILQSYYDPNIEFCYNYNETQRYAEKIRDAVSLYVNSAAVPAIAATETYQLQYNKVRDANGNWVTSGGYYNNKWLNYNCYAYSINRAEQPSFYSTGKQYQPGDMSGAGSFLYCDTIDDLAAVVQADLEAMGYSNISLSETIPTIDSSNQLICVRMSYADYHFMYYDIETNAWYHKPGSTAVLKYNLVPSNSNLWYRETSYCGTERLHHTPYDSKIIFIKYSKNQININSNVTSKEYIQPYKDIFCELNFIHSCNHEIKLSSSNSVKYEIYNDEFDIISSGSGTDININVNINKGKYYLRMNFESYTNLSYVDISIYTHPYTDHYDYHSFSQHKAYCECGEYILSEHGFNASSYSCLLCGAPHTHDYTDRYVNATKTMHRSYCICGANCLQPHVVESGSYSSGNKYALCIACKALVTVGMSYHQSIGELPHSENGSFILPDGIIVLVDEDIEAYFNGTLEFIYPDNDLEVA